MLQKLDSNEGMIGTALTPARCVDKSYKTYPSVAAITFHLSYRC